MLIDYCLVFSAPLIKLKTNESEVRAAYESIVRKIETSGLIVTNVIRTHRNDLYILVHCPQERLKKELARSQVNDWLAGIRIDEPAEANGNDKNAGISLTASERLRLIYEILTSPEAEGGCEISRDREFIGDFFPLQDRDFNKKWIRYCSSKTLLDKADMLDIRNHFGEKIAYYFEFLQTYFVWLAAPAVVGLLAWFFNEQFSIYHGMFNTVWSVMFVEFWGRKEKDLAVEWETRNFSRFERIRDDFEGEAIIDEVTGIKKVYFPAWKRMQRYLVTFPIVALLGLLLALIVAIIFAMEVFFIEYYSGPFSDYLHYLPLIVYIACIPVVSNWYYGVAQKLTNYENHHSETQSSRHLTFKIFVMNFLLGYLSIFLTAWVYIPYGDFFESFLKAFGLSVMHKSVGAERLVSQVFYFVVTAQLINVGTEVLVPWMTQRLGQKASNVKESLLGHNEKTVEADKKTLDRVRKEAARPTYDLYEDYAEMVTQFGYVALFSIVWPLTPLLCFLNNWLELRSDAVKIVLNNRRPIPSRAESIGPWLDTLRIISWLAAITNTLFVFQFGDTFRSSENELSILVGVALAVAAERFYFLLVWAIDELLDMIKSCSEQTVAKKEFELKQKWLKRMGLQDIDSEAGQVPMASRDVMGMAELETLLKTI